MMLKLVITATILFVAVLLPELAAHDQSSGYCDRCERYCCAGYVQQGTRCIKPCTDDECVHGYCSSDNSWCICYPSWEGEHCDRAILCGYPPDGCLNGGHCVAPGHCSCADGYGGDRCERVICKPCCVHGDCSAEGDCVCDPGWDGTDCSHEIRCFPSCQNGGTCISPGNCACRYGCSGYRCEDQSSACTDDECVNGNCSSDNSWCICYPNWEGEHCDRAICYPPDGCLNGGHCVAPGNCSCAVGYSGDRCERVICKPSCVHGDCSAEGDCVCDPGWYGTDCSHEIRCFPSCQNGGTCISPGHYCACRYGYSGYRCEEQSSGDGLLSIGNQ